MFLIWFNSLLCLRGNGQIPLLTIHGFFHDWLLECKQLCFPHLPQLD